MGKLVSSLPPTVARRCERITYRVAGLPACVLAAVAGVGSETAIILRSAHAHRYWRIPGAVEWFDTMIAMLIWPFALLIGASWLTLRNGSHIRRRCGRPAWRQFLDQLRLYVTAGVLPPWYYIFSLHDRPTAEHAREFLHRYETKRGVYGILKRHKRATSPLNDKYAFVERCQSHHLPVVPVLALARGGQVSGLDGDRLPDRDLFIKPLNGRGGTGAERWDSLGRGVFRGPSGEELSAAELREHLARKSRSRALIVQPRIRNCEELSDLNNHALSTVRVLTCLDEKGRPEPVAAVLRMAINANRTVDNIHAGGIAANIDLETGVLGPASDLGTDASLGWRDTHPNTGAQITGRRLSGWHDVRALAERAHRAFDDRIFIGWDIGITAEGPVIVEGNSGPDVDLMQRPTRTGLMDARYGELLAYHLRKTEAEQAQAAVSMPMSLSLR